jgi:hypothetical protein
VTEVEVEQACDGRREAIVAFGFDVDDLDNILGGLDVAVVQRRNTCSSRLRGANRLKRRRRVSMKQKKEEEKRLLQQVACEC